MQRAVPLYPGHAQPRQPHADIGYYDPRNIETLETQTKIAKTHGIHGFCFYHYWFNGKLLLEKPVENFLQAGRPDMPFCLCWANEPWTRAWDGRDRHVLMPQHYGGEQEWSDHFNYLLPAFTDPRAIRVDGRPVFLIYRIGSVTRAKDMILTWRRLAEQAGLPGLHIVAMLSVFSDSSDFKGVGIDATCEFFPTYATRPRGLDYLWGAFKLGLHLRVLKRYTPLARRSIVQVDYDYLWRRILSARKVFPIQYRGAFVSWDNTARKGHKGFIMKNATPDRYRVWLERQLQRTQADTDQAPLVFVNAWNEWAEGAYLEPDQTYGYGFLEATRSALGDLKRLLEPPSDLETLGLSCDPQIRQCRAAADDAGLILRAGSVLQTPSTRATVKRQDNSQGGLGQRGRSTAR